MGENEKRIEMKENPYDSLVKEEPIEPAIVLNKQVKQDEPVHIEPSVEIIPLSDRTIYSQMKFQEDRRTKALNITVEEELLVPDTEPDMEMIFNVDADIQNIKVEDGNLTGSLLVETMYLPNNNHNDRIIVIQSSVILKKNIEMKTKGNIECKVRHIDSHIINERKYKITAVLEVTSYEVEEKSYEIFEAIKNEELECQKEKINFLNLATTKTKETELNENLSIKDENIRPVKILKTKFSITENHKQMSKEKVITNDSIWVRIIYLAEVAYQGNLANNIMYYQGNVDVTQFISFGEESEISYCKIDSDISGLQAQVNGAGNGFRIEGIVKSKAYMYNVQEKEIITDFFHKKDKIICDKKEEQICNGLEMSSQSVDLHENITIQGGNEFPNRILYVDGKIIESSLENNEINGKLQIQILTITEDNRTVVARKNVEFTASASINDAQLEDVLIREMSADVSGSGKIDVDLQLQVKLCSRKMTSVTLIQNPCIAKEEGATVNYPIIICTVKNGETIWDIAKKYQVPADHITSINNVETIQEGMRLVIAK